MIDKANFNELVKLAMAEQGHQNMRPVIEKELLHADILFALDHESLLDGLTFQGGTSLRLCHGSNRFSEDLDFAGGPDFTSRDVTDIKQCVEDYVSGRYDLEVSVKQPDELRHDPVYAEINVDKWQVSVVTSPARRDIPKQRIKLEIANVPAYTREVRGLNLNYSFLPDGYQDLLVVTEKLDEVMADKLVSLVNTRKYVRHRDIWDLQWLKQRNASPDMDLVRKKLADYSVEDYIGKARNLQTRLPEIIDGSAFKGEMSRFLPGQVIERTIGQAKFSEYLCRENQALLERVVQALEGSDNEGYPFDFTL